MKIVAANHADTLRHAAAWTTVDVAETVVLDSVREELRSVYGDADDVVPLSLTALAQQLDRAHPGGDSIA